MPYISQPSIQEVTDRLDAITVMSEYVHLEKKGGRFWACCPFHQEKTASFTVNPDLKTYYCFGCQKGGTIINFIMEMDKLSFPEAIELMAKKTGLELVYEDSRGTNYSAEDEDKKKKKEELFELYRRISGTFNHFLLKKHEAEGAKLYIISRGINNEMIELFGLGYAPSDRYWLHKFLCEKGYSREFLAASGLFSSRDPQSSFFSGRLMFPIRDRQGRTVAFGGRSLTELSPQLPAPPSNGYTPPKYINSPEMGIYKKGETLYALDLALPEIRRTKTVYIAEGYMDVIALHQAGVVNAVAPLGTAYTEEQAKLLKRWAEKVILYFDNDQAGQSAALKGIYNSRKCGMACAIIKTIDDTSGEASLPEAKDPADILLHSGPAALLKQAKCFINDFDYLLLRAKSLWDITGSEGKVKATAFLFPYLDLLDSEVARDACIEAAADAFGLLPAVISDDYRRHQTGEKSTESGPLRHGEEINNAPIRMNDELSLLIAVAVNYVSSGNEQLTRKFRSSLQLEEIEDQYAREVFIVLEECIRHGETGMHEFLARFSSQELKKFFVERSATGEFSINTAQLVADGIKKIKEKCLRRRQEEIIIKLRTIKKNIQEEDGEANGHTARELLAEKMRIDEELCKLKQSK